MSKLTTQVGQCPMDIHMSVPTMLALVYVYSSKQKFQSETKTSKLSLSLECTIPAVNIQRALLSSSGPGPGHCPRLFSKTGVNSCHKRTRAEAIIRETPRQDS